MKFDPSNTVQCTLPKHVVVEKLHKEIPVKNLYFPLRELQCSHAKNSFLFLYLPCCQRFQSN